MFFIIFEKYCKDRLECTAYDFLNISKGCWYRLKKEDQLPLIYCKQIMYHFNECITDNLFTMSIIIIKNYSEVK